jgi:hypothetical protein
VRTLFCLGLVKAVKALCMGIATSLGEPHGLQADDIIFEALCDLHVDLTRHSKL